MISKAWVSFTRAFLVINQPIYKFLCDEKAASFIYCIDGS